MNYKKYLKLANDAIIASNCKNASERFKKRKEAINHYNTLLESIEITDYLLIDAKPVVPKEVYIEAWFNAGTLYKTQAEETLSLLEQSVKSQISKEEAFSYLHKANSCFTNILRIEFEHNAAIMQIVSVTTQICYYSKENVTNCLQTLQSGLLFAPHDPIIHYNLGFIYQRINKLELSLIHYKLSLSLQNTCEAEAVDEQTKRLKVNNLNGIAFVYRSVKQWPQALYYLQKAEKVLPKDPDIQNQLGVVYTEMRRTDLAEISYNKALEFADNTFISPNPVFFKSEILLNLGHMHSYNGDNLKAIDKYNESLKINPKFALPFQNKIMNLSYIFDCLEDKMYIAKEHKKVNRLYKKCNGMYKFDDKYYRRAKINIGIVSGDFVDHPVSYFISTFLSNYDSNVFSITCYSECMIDTKLFNPALKFKFIKNMYANEAADAIHADNIHILFDLAGHTAFNRLDIFALKPCPIQISYIGYPFSTGLDEIDYRITDNYCDKLEESQKYYTEKLVTLPSCFLCYNPNVNKHASDGKIVQSVIPEISVVQPMIQNGYVTIVCFNRLNKITDSVIQMFNDILKSQPKVKFVFKTKALLNKNVKAVFVSKFDKNVRNRIQIWECTILHEEHLKKYNKIDIAIDTFPYSGTTTSCEALLMGVPVFTLMDNKHFFHAQNVTASLLYNSDMSYYVCSSKEELIKKVGKFVNNLHNCSTLKKTVRDKFLNGKVCNQKMHVHDMTVLLNNLFTTAQHK